MLPLEAFTKVNPLNFPNWFFFAVTPYYNCYLSEFQKNEIAKNTCLKNVSQHGNSTGSYFIFCADKACAALKMYHFYWKKRYSHLLLPQHHFITWFIAGLYLNATLLCLQLLSYSLWGKCPTLDYSLSFITLVFVFLFNNKQIFCANMLWNYLHQWSVWLPLVLSLNVAFFPPLKITPT